MEEWKSVIGYEGLYEVSNQGRIKSLSNDKSKKEKILKTYLRSGYPLVQLYSNGGSRKISVHRLVAIAFIPNPDNKPVVNHKDEIKHNSCADNLEWCTVQENVDHSAYKQKRKSSEEKVEDQLNLRIRHFMSKYNLTKEELIARI